MKDGFYVSKKGIQYEICNNQIMVEHPNGYYGCLYGKSSMAIYYGNDEVLHTGSRSIDTPDELYEQLADMPKFIKMLATMIECNDFGDEDI